MRVCECNSNVLIPNIIFKWCTFLEDNSISQVYCLQNRRFIHFLFSIEPNLFGAFSACTAEAFSKNLVNKHWGNMNLILHAVLLLSLLSL